MHRPMNDPIDRSVYALSPEEFDRSVDGVAYIRTMLDAAPRANRTEIARVYATLCATAQRALDSDIKAKGITL